MKSTGTVRVVGAAIAACLTVGAGSAAAYTVRPPELQSYLGQPLRMLIRIDLGPGEQPPESIQLASQDDIARLGLDALAARSSDLRLRREEGTNGVEVYVDSPGGLSEPMFAVVLDVRRGDLRTLHQVTVMLDPPPGNASATLLAGKTPSPAAAPDAGSASVSAVPAAATQAAATAVTARRPASSHRVHHAAPSPSTASRLAAGDTYGPVRHGETLSGIARKVRADRHVSVNELVKALVALNPRATHGRESFVAEGATLQLPRELTAAASLPRQSVAQAVPAPVPTPIPAPAMAAAAAPVSPSVGSKTSAPVATILPVTPASGAGQPMQRFQMATSLGSLPAAAPAVAPAGAAPGAVAESAGPAVANPPASTAAATAAPAQAAQAPVAQAAAPATAEPAASAPAANAATTVSAAKPALPSISDNIHSIVAATPSVEPAPAAEPVVQPRINLYALGGLGALLAAAAAGLFLWARRGASATGIGGRDAAVLTPRGANDSVSDSPFDIDAALAERKRTGELTNADRVVLLKQAYAARGKRVRDVNQG